MEESSMPYGTVKEKKGDLVVVSLERQDMCGDCHACEMLSGKKTCTLNCKSQIPCEIGDQVEITLAQERFIKATYLMYGIPLVGFVVGLLAGYAIGMVTHLGEIIGIIGAIVGMCLGFMLIKRKEKKKQFQKYLPQIIAKR